MDRYSNLGFIERGCLEVLYSTFCYIMPGTRRLWQNSHIFTLSCPQAFSEQSLPQLVMPAESSAENPAKRADRLYQASGHSDVQACGNNKATLIGIEPLYLFVLFLYFDKIFLHRDNSEMKFFNLFIALLQFGNIFLYCANTSFSSATST